MEWLANSEVWASLATLTALEIVLGIDNIVMIAVIAAGLPPEQRDRVRTLGLAIALLTRLLLLFTLSWLVSLTAPLFTVMGEELSGRDLVMLAGGVFLLWKAVHEMHAQIEEAGHEKPAPRVGTMTAAVTQIVLLDVVFSFDSVITAVGMANHLGVMVAAIVISMVVMLVASGPIMRFVHAHPSIKVLALAFVMLIGVALIADGLEFHIPKGYIYAAMTFSLMVEAVNLAIAARRRRVKSPAGPHA